MSAMRGLGDRESPAAPANARPTQTRIPRPVPLRRAGGRARRHRHRRPPSRRSAGDLLPPRPGGLRGGQRRGRRVDQRGGEGPEDDAPRAPPRTSTGRAGPAAVDVVDDAVALAERARLPPGGRRGGGRTAWELPPCRAGGRPRAGAAGRAPLPGGAPFAGDAASTGLRRGRGRPPPEGPIGAGLLGQRLLGPGLLHLGARLRGSLLRLRTAGFGPLGLARPGRAAPGRRRLEVAVGRSVRPPGGRLLREAGGAPHSGFERPSSVVGGPAIRSLSPRHGAAARRPRRPRPPRRPRRTARRCATPARWPAPPRTRPRSGHARRPAPRRPWRPGARPDRSRPPLEPPRTGAVSHHGGERSDGQSERAKGVKVV